jgi:hypothetical protein
VVPLVALKVAVMVFTTTEKIVNFVRTIMVFVLNAAIPPATMMSEKHVRPVLRIAEVVAATKSAIMVRPVLVALKTAVLVVATELVTITRPVKAAPKIAAFAAAMEHAELEKIAPIVQVTVVLAPIVVTVFVTEKKTV